MRHARGTLRVLVPIGVIAVVVASFVADGQIRSAVASAVPDGHEIASGVVYAAVMAVAGAVGLFGVSHLGYPSTSARWLAATGTGLYSAMFLVLLVGSGGQLDDAAQRYNAVAVPGFYETALLGMLAGWLAGVAVTIGAFELRRGAERRRDAARRARLRQMRKEQRAQRAERRRS